MNDLGGCGEGGDGSRKIQWGGARSGSIDQPMHCAESISHVMDLLMIFQYGDATEQNPRKLGNRGIKGKRIRQMMRREDHNMQ